MTREPVPGACRHCGTVPVVKRVQTALLGTRPVDIARCKCDLPTCPHDGCDASLAAVPFYASRCPRCQRSLRVPRT